MRRMFKSKILAGVAAVLCVASLSLAQPVDEQGAAPGMDKNFRPGNRLFAQADQDGDGSVTWEEFKTAHEQRLKQRFYRLDANQNGTIEQEEAQAAAEQMRGRMGGRRGSKGNFQN